MLVGVVGAAFARRMFGNTNVFLTGQTWSGLLAGFSMSAIRRRQSSLAVSSMRRGTGLRSSFSGNVVTVFGATGFVGRVVCSRLGKTGSQIIVPYDCDPYFAETLKVVGDLGQVLFYPFYLKDADTVRKAMEYSNVVINLVGQHFETRNYKFNDVHVEGARLIARCARECEVKTLLHFSALNARPDPQEIYLKPGSPFLRSKYYGELAVREEFPEAIIFRPADIYGNEDLFLRYYFGRWNKAYRRQTLRTTQRIALWRRGNATIKMPVYVKDVVKAVLEAVNNPDSPGQTYEIVGPERYFLADFIDYCNQLCYSDVKRVEMTVVDRMYAYLWDLWPFNPRVNADRLEREFITDNLTGCPTMEDLGITPTHFPTVAPHLLRFFRNMPYYADELYEIPKPDPPRTVDSYTESEIIRVA